MQENQRKDLTISIVNWNSGHLIIKCLDSILRTVSRHSFQIFVVDNDSEDDSVEMIHRRFPNVILIQNQDNLGYARAHNQVLSIIETPYILLLNPDCEFMEDAIDRVLDVMDANPHAGLAGCRVLFSDQTVQNTIIACPTLTSELKRFLIYQFYPFSNLMRQIIDQATDPIDGYRDMFLVKAIGGPFLMARTSMLLEIGQLDEDFFLFSEEIDLCLRAEKRNWDILYIPDCSVHHFLGKCREKAPTEFSEYHFQRSRLIFFLKHKGFLAWALLCCISMFFCAWSYVVEFLKTGIFIALGKEHNSLYLRNIAARKQAIIDVIKHSGVWELPQGRGQK